MAGSGNSVKQRLIEVRRALAGGRDLDAFQSKFLDGAPDLFVLGYRPEDLAGLIARGFQTFKSVKGSAVAVHVFNPSRAATGFESANTVIQATAPDRPFYVTSIRECLRSLNHPIVHLIHPIIPVMRSADGVFQSIGQSPRAIEQSFVHIEIRRVDDPSAMKKIELEIHSIYEAVGAMVEDFPDMTARLDDAVKYLQKLKAAGYKPRTPEEPPIPEIADFLKWLVSGNFVLMGCREYDIVDIRGGKAAAVVKGSGRGILRDERRSMFYHPVPVGKLAPGLRARIFRGPLLMVTETNHITNIYRHARMQYIGVKKLDARGTVVGEYRFLGHFTNRVLSTAPTDVPVLRLKFRKVVEAAGAQEHSHDYREIFGLFQSFPKIMLFSASVDDMRKAVRAAMAAQIAGNFKATFKPDPMGRGVAVMIVMPRDRFHRSVRANIERRLRERLAADHVDYSLSMGEGEFARLYFFCQTDRQSPVGVTFAELEDELAEIAKTWYDRLADELLERLGPKAGTELNNIYQGAFSEEYQYHTPVNGAYHDILKFEELHKTGEMQIDLYNSQSDEDCSRLKIYALKQKLLLSNIMPILTNHGFTVVDEMANSARTSRRPLAYVHTFRVRGPLGKLDVERLTASIGESILGVLAGDLEDDPLSALILLAGLTPRQVKLLRLYRNYIHQIIPVHNLLSINEAMVKNPKTTRALVRLFAARFLPDLGVPDSTLRRAEIGKADQQFEDCLNAIPDLMQDRILRHLAGAVRATIRSNFYLDRPNRTLAVKMRSADVPVMPEPRPMFEIYVSGPRVEGIHLRGGRVARGGIRWSDRKDDFRTEVLGLMKTQMVKNSIIIPVGSKGGFVMKRDVPKDEVRDEVLKCYKAFIRALISLTDNIVSGKTLRPAGLVIHDEPDPYLVVAADKGTATFSDTANGLSAEAQFWLDDAFASGGSDGYDHKIFGITARGAWECIGHHLWALGMDISRRAVSCVGIGDMSGDVFGNGLLHSPNLKLLGAFNHLHIFIDPNPNLRAAFAERKRLFKLPRSTWADYNPKRISKGGGVYLRAAKEIPLSPDARKMLGIAAAKPSGEDVIKAMMRMEVDLLYNGGIGTYVKASTERNADVGDETNDRVRVDASELKCRVMGEGGNLGLTQAARIEFARRGGRINTDAVDNSAGVDMSDHEVNLKILFAEAMDAKKLTRARRNAWLVKLSGEVSRLVLADNRSQALAISQAERESVREISFYPQLFDDLQTHAALSREVEGLPGDKEIQRRIDSGEGMLRPELAVLLAYVKMVTDESIQREGARLLADPILGPFLARYFPKPVRSAFSPFIPKHKLAPQIIATTAANVFVNQTGLTTGLHLEEEYSVGLVDVVRAYFASESLTGAARLRAEIIAQQAVLPPNAFYGALERIEFGLLIMTHWFLRNCESSKLADVCGAAAAKGALAPALKRLPPPLKQRLREGIERLESLGVPARLAKSVEELTWSVSAAEISTLASSTPALRNRVSASHAANVYFACDLRLRMTELMARIAAVPKSSAWEKVAFNRLVTDLKRAHLATCATILRSKSSPASYFERRPPRDYDEQYAAVQKLAAPDLSAFMVLIDKAVQYAS